MRSQLRRLDRVSEKLAPPKPVEWSGSYETHYTLAFSAANLASAPATLKVCEEHGPTCGISVVPIMANIRRVMILASGYVELG